MSDKNVVVEASSKKTSDDLYTISNRIKLGGTGSIENRSIEIKAKGQGTLTVYMMSSSVSEERTVNLLDSNENIISSIQGVNGNLLDAYKFNVPSAGTFYLASASSGLNVYYAYISYSEEPAYISGDVNNDMVVNVFDLIDMRKNILYGTITEGSAWAKAADLNNDGNANVADIVLMNNYLLSK